MLSLQIEFLNYSQGYLIQQHEFLPHNICQEMKKVSYIMHNKILFHKIRTMTVIKL